MTVTVNKIRIYLTKAMNKTFE